MVANSLRHNADSPSPTAGAGGWADAGDAGAALMLKYREGDLGAFEILYARHRGPLYRYLLRQVRNAAAASDLFQEVWSRIIATRARYEPRAKFATYLFHIAHNVAMDHHRRGAAAGAQPRPPDQDAAAEAAVPEYEHPDRIAELGQQTLGLLAALAALPAEQREAFLLHQESGLGIEEIARVTSVGVETAKSRLRYAVRKLKKSMLDAAAPVERAARTRAVRAV